MHDIFLYTMFCVCFGLVLTGAVALAIQMIINRLGWNK